MTINKNVLVINPYEKELSIKGNYLPEFVSLLFKEPRPAQKSDNIIADYYQLYDEIAIQNQVKYKKLWEWCFGIG